MFYQLPSYLRPVVDLEKNPVFAISDTPVHSCTLAESLFPQMPITYIKVERKTKGLLDSQYMVHISGANRFHRGVGFRPVCGLAKPSYILSILFLVNPRSLTG
jgi:hypothetical protein